MSRRILHLPDALAAMIHAAAARAYPAECCGLIEGLDVADGWRATAVHEAANQADEPARHFLVDPKVQFRLLRALTGGATRVIGCYHSHPDGTPVPSETDRLSAYEPGFLWLIAGGSPAAGFALSAHLFTADAAFVPIPIGRESAPL